LEGLRDLGDTVVHVVAYMYVPPAAPAAPSAEYKRGRCMASVSRVRSCVRRLQCVACAQLALTLAVALTHARRATSPPRCTRTRPS
jgi:hypothetical protein